MPNPFADELAPENPFSDRLNPFADENQPAPIELDEQGFPIDISPRQRKRMELASELAAEQGRSEPLEEDAASMASQERTYKAFSRPVATAINLPGEIIGALRGKYGPDQRIYTPGQKINVPRPTGTGVGAGVGRLAANVVQPFTDPDEAFKLIGAANPIGRALMATQMAQDVPEQVENAVAVVSDPKSTKADIIEAVGTPVVTAAMLKGITHTKTPPPNMPEYPGLPDPDLVARNIGTPGTIRPQELKRFNLPDITVPPEMFEAGEVPFNRMQRFGGQQIPPVDILPRMGRIENVPILEETRPKEQLETRGKVSFGAEASTLLRNAVEKAEEVGLEKSARAAKAVADEELTKAKGQEYAQRITEPASVPQPEIRPPVGESAPLRQQGEAAEVQAPAEVLPEAPKEVATTTSLPAAAEISKRPVADIETDLAKAREEVRSFPKVKPEEIAGMSQQQVAEFLNVRDKARQALAVKSQALEEGLKMAKAAAPKSSLTSSPEFEKGSIHINLRGGEIDPSKPLTGWTLPAELGDYPNTMNTRYGAAGKTAVFVPREWLNKSKDRPTKIKSGYIPKPEHIRVIPPEAIRKSGTVDWSKVFTDDSRLKLEKESEPKKGLIYGSAAEKWADDILGQDPRTKTRAFIDPVEEGKRIAAFAVKGAAIIERGVTDFAKWSEEMVHRYGPDIKDSLKQIYGQSQAFIEREKSTVSGGGEKMRKSAARATNAEMIPEPVQERIAGAPESRYRQQSMDRVEAQVGGMDEVQLAGVDKSTDIYTAAKLEQARRLFEKGDNEAGYKVFVELEKEGTRLGQLINQFKLLNGTTPEQVASVIDTGLKTAGKDGLTPKQTVEAIKIAKEAKAKDADLSNATEAWKADPSEANAAKAEKALEESNKAALELQKFTAKFTPRSTSSILKSVLQGNLLTPISETANLVGNVSFLPFRAGTRGIASGLDIIDNFLTKRPREISVGPVSGTVAAAKGAVEGLKQAPSILAHGSGDVIKGESRAGLHPIRAWVNQFARNPEMPTTGGKLTLKDRLNLAIEGTFGVPAEAMLRGLGAGDAPFKAAAHARVIAEQLRLKKVPKEQWSFAQKFPELFFDKATMEQIGADTAAAVFQRESKTLGMMTKWLHGKGDLVDFAAATVAPYKLTPWNIIGEVLSYNPMIAMSKTIRDAAKGNHRAAKINAGKLVIGGIMAGASAWLYQKGLIAPSLDEKDEAQKARILSGQVLPPNHINISGLKRALEGGDPAFKPGDETRDFFRSGGLAGSMLYMTANVGRDLEKKPDNADMAMSILRQSTLEQARFGINQSFLQGVEGLLTAIKEGNPDNYLRQWFSTVLSIPLPNSMATLSRATRQYKPDFREEDFKKQIGNVIKNRLGFSGLDDYLPLKRDFWGQPIPETPKDRNALFYHFFDVSKGKQVTDDPVALELYRLWRVTADSKVIPSLVNKEITIGNQTSNLDAAQQSRYAELVGTERRRIVEGMVVNPEFHKLNNEDKIKVLNKAYEAGMAVGKAKFIQENPTLEPKKPKSGFK